MDDIAQPSALSLAPAPQLSRQAAEAWALQLESRAPREFAKALNPPLTRAEVVTIYNTEYVPGNTSPAAAWTGSVASCTPGAISSALRNAMINRVNVFRKLARLNTVVPHSLVDVKDERTMAASLMFVANGQLSHSIDSTTFPSCYATPFLSGETVGQSAQLGASNSNIGLASGTNVFATPQIIDAYVDDSGGGNSIVGHRRWILYPPNTTMTASSVPTSSGYNLSANALYVLDVATWNADTAAPEGVAWPPKGYFPYQLLPVSSNRWSFSFPGANFASATVTMTKAGQPVAILGYDSRTDNGYGDNTIVWRPTTGTGANAVSYTNPGADTPYNVTVSGIDCSSAESGCASTMSYTVTVIDPATGSNPIVSGSTQFNGAAVNANVSFCSNPAGVTCTTSGTTYSCTVPLGYTGTLHAWSTAYHYEALQLTNVTANLSTNFNTSRSESASACILDIDRNGLYDPAVDGVAIMRRMAGFDVNAFTNITPGVCARNTTAQALFDAATPTRFNVAGATNGPLLTADGLIIERVLRGMRANSIANAIPPGATRTQWAGTGQVQQWFTNTCGYPAN